jgi:hypothetical protein
MEDIRGENLRKMRDTTVRGLLSDITVSIGFNKGFLLFVDYPI